MINRAWEASMYKRFFSLIFAGLLVFNLSLANAADTTVVMQQIAALSDSIEQAYCPDSRTSVWKIQVEYKDDAYLIRGETDKAPARKAFLAQMDQQLRENITAEIKLLPEDTVGDLSFGVPINSVVTLRSGPSVFKDMVTQTLLGIPVEILKKEGYYYFVRTEDGYLGWVARDRVVQGGDALRQAWQPENLVVYRDIEGLVYTQKSRTAIPLGDAVLGDRFLLLEQSWRWMKVGYADGREGYIPTRELVAYDTYAAREISAEGVLQTAFSLNGRPYHWGAASPKAMDCSGFTQTVFRNNGFLLLRDASMQVTQGSAVDTSGFLEQLEPADLLFFGSQPGRITHVGIYIGDLKFIHCSGRVRIDSFDPSAENYNAYRRRGLQQVKRIIQ